MFPAVFPDFPARRNYLPQGKSLHWISLNSITFSRVVLWVLLQQAPFLGPREPSLPDALSLWTSSAMSLENFSVSLWGVSPGKYFSPFSMSPAVLWCWGRIGVYRISPFLRTVCGPYSWSLDRAAARSPQGRGLRPEERRIQGGLRGASEAHPRGGWASHSFGP